MAKKPSAETELKRLRPAMARLQQENALLDRNAKQAHRELESMRQRLAEADAERVKLIDAVCSLSKGEKTAVRTGGFFGYRTFKLNPGSLPIPAIKALREAGGLGLLEGKAVVCDGASHVFSDEEEKALAPFGVVS